MSRTKAAPRKRAPKPYAVPAGRALMLRTCDAQLRGHGGFQWPDSGMVECPDWSPEPTCGHGLHGLLWGAGDATVLTPDDASRRWMVCEVEASDVVEIDRKVKAPRAWVVYVGERDGAISMISTYAPAGTQVVFGTATAGDGGTATAGYRGTATAGYRGTATAGDGGTATAGDGGTATAGDGGTATAGQYGCVCIEWYDAKRSVYRKAVAEVDGEIIKPGVAYVVRDGVLVAKASS